MGKMSQQWIDDCIKWRGRVLTGKHGHWCGEWDDLPVDETTDEWPCGCIIAEATQDNPQSDPGGPKVE
jgi:hypothetical protein